MKRSRVVCLLLILAVGLGVAGSLWAAAGDMLWETKFNFLPDRNFIYPYAVAASANTVIVCGNAKDTLTGTHAPLGFIKAFDATSGTPKWEGEPLTLGTNYNEFNSIVVVGNTVIVEGYACSYTLNPNNTITYTLNQSRLRTYNADTGALLWEVIKNNYTPMNFGPSGIVVANNRAFVVQEEWGASGSTGNYSVQAYQVGSVPLAGLPLLLDQ